MTDGTPQRPAIDIVPSVIFTRPVHQAAFSSIVGGIQTAVGLHGYSPVAVRDGNGDVWRGTPNPRAVAVVQDNALSARPEPGSSDIIPARRICSYEQTLNSVRM